MTQALFRLLPGILLMTATLFSQTSPSKHYEEMKNRYLNAPISFEVNRGQAVSETQFLSHGAGYSLLFSERAVTLELLRKNKANQTARHQIRTTFVGANPNARPSGEEKLPGVTNYLTGSDPSRWLTNLPTYARLRFPAIYPGIDLVYYGNQSHLEYDFQVAAQSDTGRIRLRVEGAKLDVTRDGELVMATPAGGIAWRKPVAYQTIAGEKQAVACSYVVSGDQVRFALGPYDHQKALTIDPPLVWGSFLGGSRYELVDGIGVDAAGELVVAGTTISTDFPTTSGAYGRTFKSTGSGYALDPFVTKFSADGTHLVYSTYVTGAGGGFVNGMSVDGAGNAYVSGNPGSSDFPVTPGSYHAPQNGISNFLFKLNPSGNSLIYSLVALASGPVAVDVSGDAFVAGPWGVNSSVPYPFTPSNAYHNQLVTGKNYISVAKYNSAGTALDYAALIGSAGTNYAAAIAVDSLGEATIAGHNYSLNYPPPKYPVTAGEPAGMGDDTIVTKFNASATALVYSALLNGSQGFGISADANGSVAVTGTASPALPTTANAYEAKFQSSANGVHEPFLTVLDPTGHLTYSTFFAGNAPSDTYEYGFDTALESGGVVNLVGSKHSSNFPITDATYLTNDCEWIARLNSAGSGKSSLLYSGCFSTNVNPNQPIFDGYLALNGDGNVYIAGQDTGPTRLTSAQTWNHFGDPGQNSGYELWVGEMNFAHPPAPPAVVVSLPPNGEVSTLPQHYVASAASPGCSLGVAAVGVYTAPGKLQAYQNGPHLDVTFSLPAGQYNTVVQEWDKCGGAQKTPISISIPPGGIAVSSPANNSTVTSPVHFAATATSPTCANGFSSGIRIYTAPGVDAYDGGTTIDTNLALSPGTYHVVLQASDNCNNIFQAPLTITVK